MKKKGKTFLESDSSKSFGNPLRHLDSIPDSTPIPASVFQKHEVLHAYADVRSDHGMPQFDDVSYTEREKVVGMLNDAISNPKYGPRTSRAPEDIPEHLREKIEGKRVSNHVRGHGAIPTEPPQELGEFQNMSRSQIAVVQTLPAYSFVIAFQNSKIGSVEEFKNVVETRFRLVLREEREEDDCILLSYKLDDVGRYYVCFIVTHEKFVFHYFYSCDCQIK